MFSSVDFTASFAGLGTEGWSTLLSSMEYLLGGEVFRKSSRMIMLKYRQMICTLFASPSVFCDEHGAVRKRISMHGGWFWHLVYFLVKEILRADTL